MFILDNAKIIQSIYFFISLYFIIFFILTYRKNILLKYFTVISFFILIHSLYMIAVKFQNYKAMYLLIENIFLLIPSLIKLYLIFYFIKNIFKHKIYKNITLIVFSFIYILVFLTCIFEKDLPEPNDFETKYFYLFVYSLYIATNIAAILLIIKKIICERKNIAGGTLYIKKTLHKEFSLLKIESFILIISIALLPYINDFISMNMIMPSLLLIGIFLYTKIYLSYYQSQIYGSILFKISSTFIFLISCVLILAIIILEFIDKTNISFDSALFFKVSIFTLFISAVLFPLTVNHFILKDLYNILIYESGINDSEKIPNIEIKRESELKDIYILSETLKESMNKSVYEYIKKQNNIKMHNLEYQYIRKKNDFKNISLSVSRSLQRQMLKIPKIDCINTNVIYKPTEAIGGDIYDISEINDGQVRVFLADAAGHGVPAAIFATLLKNEYKNMKETFSQTYIFERFNELFLGSYNQMASFFTAIIIDIFYKKQTIVYSSAAHPLQYAILDNEAVALKGTQMMPGIDERYFAKSVSLKYKDNFKIILFTDGLFELKSLDGKIYSAKYLDDIIEKTKNKNVKDMLDELVKETSEWAGSEYNKDDITLIGIENEKYYGNK